MPFPFGVFQVFCGILLLLVGAVFTYTPGDIAATQIFGFDGKATSLVITVWMFENGKKRYVWMPLIPGTFYAFATVTYIMNAKIGFNMAWGAAYGIGAVAAAAYLAIILWYGNKRAARLRR